MTPDEFTDAAHWRPPHCISRGAPPGSPRGHLGKGRAATYVEPMAALRRIALVVVLLGAPLAAPAGQDDGRLDGLFARLQATTDVEEAGLVQAAIWRIWIAADEAPVDAAMGRGIAEMELGDYPAARRHFDTVIGLAPNLAEGWNKRATVLYLMGDFGASVRDIQRTLALEPRHWGALSGLGLIGMAQGDLAGAVKAFESAVAINPHLHGTKMRIHQLHRMIRKKSI